MKQVNLVVQAPLVVKGSAVALFLLSVFVTVTAAMYWREFTRFGHFAMIAGIVVFIAVTADAFQRQYIFEFHTIRLRILFCWKSYDIPISASIDRDDQDRIVVTESESGRCLITIPQPYSANISLEKLRMIIHEE